MRGIRYLRVSTRDQAENGYGLDAQEQHVVDFCRTEGVDLVADPFVDGGRSGDLPLAEREGLLAALQYCAARVDDPLPIEAVVVARFDRLGRDLYEQLAAEREFNALGVRVLCAQGMNDTDDPMVKAMRGFMMVISELDKAMLLKRLADGKAAKARRGGYIGGRPYLGVRAEGGELVTDDDEARLVEHIFTRVARDRWPVSRVVIELNNNKALDRRWTKKGLLMVLHREAYKKGADPIVDPRLWNRAQRQLEGRRRVRTAA